jgi:hypothetical protein
VAGEIISQVRTHLGLFEVPRTWMGRSPKRRSPLS